MASEQEITMAADAIREIVPPGYGMTWEEARGFARAALEAGARERDRFRRENCQHPSKRSNGTLGSDGSSSWSWYCPDCGNSGSAITPARATAGQ